MTNTVTTPKEHISLASESGFIAAAEKANTINERYVRLVRAYEHFRYVTEENVKAFNEKLKKSTERTTGTAGYNLTRIYDELALMPIGEYKDMPPADVLMKVKSAADMKIFDEFELAKIKSKREYLDPIVFGRITGCKDRFYIAQWDNDVTIDQLIEAHEG